MSIPERFYRIAKHKLSEVKERIDRWDEEAQEEEEAERKRSQKEARLDAQRELNDSLEMPRAFSGKSETTEPTSLPGQERGPRPRTPEEIARGYRPVTATAPPPPANTVAQTTSAVTPTDALTPHYQLLGVEPGSDFIAVQAAYNKLAARCEPSRFPAGSEEEKQALAIRQRLEEAYKALRDALDPTARRFDMLEFDSPKSSADTKSL